MNIKTRLQRLEDAGRADPPLLVLWQDWDDPDLFYDGERPHLSYRDDYRPGQAYRRGVNWPAEDDYTLLLVTYEKDWRNEREK